METLIRPKKTCQKYSRDTGKSVKMKRKIIAGSRGSKLALIQTNFVIDLLKSSNPCLEIDIKVIKTTGDKIQDKQLSKIGGKGLFIKEIEEALALKEIDFAVHSMKDVPHTLLETYQIAAIMEREDPRDILICREGYSLTTLPAGARVGTGSLRRHLQIKALRSELEIIPIRGNIDTRINKLASGDYDAIILAAAGLKRMGWQNYNDSSFFKTLLRENTNEKLCIEFLATETFIPAIGQGALAIETLTDNQELADIIRPLHNETDAYCVLAERAFLKEVDGGCEIPIGAYAYIYNDRLIIDGFLGDEYKGTIYRQSISGSIDNYKDLGVNLAKILLAKRKAGF
jgi:hydroxymethylbilane synthase